MELRRSIYLILTIIAAAIAAARVVGVENVIEPSRYAPPPGGFGDGRIDAPLRNWPVSRPEPTPMLSSNDRSRWATVRALVDHGTFVIGHRDVYEDPKSDRGLIFEDGWQSLDKVMNPVTHDYYSSKPPLFSVLLAGEYWILKQFGWNIAKDKWFVVGFILLTVNVLPFAISLLLLSRLIEQYGTTDFGKLITFATAAVGTFWLTFSSTLNNHTPAACCVVFAICRVLGGPNTTAPPLREGGGWGEADAHPPLTPPSREGDITATRLVVSGFFAALTATFDLPAASFAAALLVMVFIRERSRTLLFAAGMVVPVVAFFAANYAALGRWLPAYGEFGGPWYDYPGSHWAKLQLAKSGTHVPGIDFARDSRGVYLLHCLIGHHGWFSLTPMWLIGIIGVGVTMRNAVRDLVGVPASAALAAADEDRLKPGLQHRQSLSFPLFVQLGGLLFLVLVVFFVYVQRTNNYGGNTSGLRWFFWLIPLALLATLAGADRIAHWKWARILMCVCLGFSVLSAFYPAWNPWRSPWIMVMMERLEWVNYEKR